MKHVITVFTAVGIVLAPAAVHAQTTKKIRASHAYLRPVPFQHAPDARFMRGFIDPCGGNAAVCGNNANSMDGSNSSNNNANGRSSGGRG